MRWAQEQRMKFIARRIDEPPHHVNRGDLRDEFRISTPQASLDLQLFMAMHPGRMAYNFRAKRYERREHSS